MEHEKMLSVRQVAERLSVTPMTILRHINDPTRPLPAQMVGKQWVILQSDLDAWQAHRRPPGRPRTRHLIPAHR